MPEPTTTAFDTTTPTFDYGQVAFDYGQVEVGPGLPEGYARTTPLPTVIAGRIGIYWTCKSTNTHRVLLWGAAVDGVRAEGYEDQAVMASAIEAGLRLRAQQPPTEPVRCPLCQKGTIRYREADGDRFLVCTDGCGRSFQPAVDPDLSALRRAVTRYLKALRPFVGHTDTSVTALCTALDLETGMVGQPSANEQGLQARLELQGEFLDATYHLVQHSIQRHGGGSWDHAVTALATAPEGSRLGQDREALIQQCLNHLRIDVTTSSLSLDRLESALAGLHLAGLIPSPDGHTVISPTEALAKAKVPQATIDLLRESSETHDARGRARPMSEYAVRQVVCAILGENVWGYADFSHEEAVLRHLATLVQRKQNGRADGQDIALVDFAPTVRVVVEVAKRVVAANILKLHGIDMPARVDDLPQPVG